MVELRIMVLSATFTKMSAMS